jgi:hypothetical protein
LLNALATFGVGWVRGVRRATGAVLGVEAGVGRLHGWRGGEVWVCQRRRVFPRFRYQVTC